MSAKKKTPARNPPARSDAQPAPARAAASGADAGALRAELRRLDQQISRIAGVGRPTDARQQRLAEKQDLLAQKATVQAKLRALTTPTRSA